MNEQPCLMFVVAEQNVEDYFKVIKQLLENVDTICDFQKFKII